MKSKNTGYIEQLDHLRFFAAAVVLLFHASIYAAAAGPRYDQVQPGGWLWPTIVGQGHIGVQLFMVISGFILAVISHDKEINVWRFYWNRILRIYPLLTFIVALGFYSLPKEETSRFLIALLPIFNISRYYGEFGGQAWSIAIELQFYLLFPIFQAALRNGPRYHIGAILFLILIRIAVYSMNGAVHAFAFLTPFGEFDVFLIGHLCGWLYMRGKLNLSNPLWLVGSFVALNAYIWAVFSSGTFYSVAPANAPPECQSWYWIIHLDVLALLFSVLLVAYLQMRWRVVGSALLSALGRYSYSLYLWHMFVVMLVLKWELPFPALVTLALTIPISWASYHLIEEPFLVRRVRYVTHRSDG